MKLLFAIVLSIVVLPAARVAGQPAAAPTLERHEFAVRNFKTEIGVVLPEARLVYTTLGRMNAGGTNAILLPSHYMADFNGYNWLIGSNADRVFNPSRDFLVLTELFGNGRSSSPSNTAEPFHGPRFPVTTIRDNVKIVYRLRTEEFSVKHLRAVVGFSMGAEQAFQWAVSHPDFMDAIVATAGTAKCYGHGFVRLEGQITSLTTDPAWQGGDYSSPPARGLEAFSWCGPAGSTRRSGGGKNCGERSLQRGRRSISICRDGEARSERMRTTTFFKRAPGSATTWVRRPGLAVTSNGRSSRSRCASSTCRQKPTCTFR